MSIGELRAALVGVADLTAEASAHARLAAERLDEAAETLADLALHSGSTLPTDEFARAREEVEALVGTLDSTRQAVADLDARL
ncbi:hypothetical protein [Pseudonocardia pini]|uniref:hypothetical protein n=1 Tax=Pseudonocardia pini TaxID=2758030 RepID=UPI0015F0396B|nr:hypothetical protein [Pseudonocardia pini]